MNPLPRFLGMALFVVLAVLAALLAAPLWQHAGAPSRSAETATLAPSGAPEAKPVTAPRTAQMAVFSQRVALGVALVGLAVAAALVVSHTMQSSPARDTRPPFSTARHEIDTLAKLAETSVAQGAELSRERDVRRRAEEDAELKQRLLAQSVDEKIRLGRDLHDGIIQSLYAVGLMLESIRPLLKSNPAEAEQRVDQIRTSLNAAIRDVRTYITGLAPENLRRASFSRGVNALFDELRAGRTAQFEINIDDAAAARLSVEQNVEALQIAREAISNALRHGNASLIKLRMHQGDGEVCLLIQDDGGGFDAMRSRSDGHGLANMRARAERLGASLRVTSQPGEGARVLATFPITAASVV